MNNMDVKTILRKHVLTNNITFQDMFPRYRF